jgi:hypothetical protein
VYQPRKYLCPGHSFHDFTRDKLETRLKEEEEDTMVNKLPTLQSLNKIIKFEINK